MGWDDAECEGDNACRLHTQLSHDNLFTVCRMTASQCGLTRWAGTTQNARTTRPSRIFLDLSTNTTLQRYFYDTLKRLIKTGFFVNIFERF